MTSSCRLVGGPALVLLTSAHRAAGAKTEALFTQSLMRWNCAVAAAQALQVWQFFAILERDFGPYACLPVLVKSGVTVEARRPISAPRPAGRHF
jgi:hypothetical protein